LNTLFARVMAVVLAVIVLLTVALGSMTYFSLRNQRIEARLEELVAQAEDIAYLAADVSGSVYLFQTDTQRYMNRKAKQVNDEFGAYIAVVDRWGNLMDNLQTAYSEDPDFVASLSGDEIADALQKVLNGETVRVQSEVGSDPTFTVGVPFLQGETVVGAVVIQTKAQRIESGMEDLILRVSGAALAAALISGVALWFVLRSIMRPLKEMRVAAEAVAEGDFSHRLNENTGARETRTLAETFNQMSGKLEDLEMSRREFVANVSHELRSPITSIKGFAEGMADGVIPEEEHPKYLRLVADESTRLSRLIGDLLELSRLERDDAALEMSEFDMNEVLRRAVIRRMNDLETRKIDTDCDFREDPCMVRADSERIEQVVINLLDNAIKFTPDEGQIRLTTEKVSGEVRVTVWDSGAQIPEEDRGKVFDRFFTADRAHTAGKGTGLGLSICQRIMGMHGREIRLMDTEEGTAFRFTLDPAEG